MNHLPNSKMSAQEYCLRWKYHHNNLQQMFSNLLERQCYTDVTLACEGKTLRAHKMVLSACSTYFDSIFSEYAEKNPIVILKDVKYMDMKSLVNFMYRGEINVQNSHLTSLLKTAEDLRIKGLAQMSWPEESSNDTVKENIQGNGSEGQWKHRSSEEVVTPQINQTSSVSNGSESPANKRRRPNSFSPKLFGESEEQTQWDNDDSEPEIISGETIPSDQVDRNYGSMMSHNSSMSQLSDTFNDRNDGDGVYNNSSGGQDSLPVVEPLPQPAAPPPQTPSISSPLLERFRDVIKMNDYLVSGRRPQFWEEPFTRNVMEAIRAKEIEMKAGAEILGVSYGTLYGRYREAFGCLKHPYRVRDFWSEQGPSEVLAKLQRKELSLFRAAEILNVTVTTLANYLSTLRQDDAGPYSRNDSHDHERNCVGGLQQQRCCCSNGRGSEGRCCIQRAPSEACELGYQSVIILCGAMASNSPSSSHNTTPQRSRPGKRQHPAVLNGVGGSFEDKNNDYLCPICFELIQEAHMTRCGHTFCHQCIAKSLSTSGRCPKCSYSVGSLENVFPNYILNELISKFKAKAKIKNEFSASSSSSREWSQSPVDGLREFVSTESRNLTLPDVNVILELLTQRKSLLEAESSFSQNKLLHEFLEHLLRMKEAQLDLLNKEVTLIKHDLQEVEHILKDCTPGLEDTSGVLDSRTSSLKSKKKAISNSLDSSTPQDDTVSQDGEGFNEKRLSGNTVENRLASRRKRMHTHFEDFMQCYLNIRAKEVTFGRSCDKPNISTETGSVSAGGLDTFRENLVKFSRFNYLRPLATLNYSSDIFNNSTIVSSIEFDKDNEFFAIAGVTKRIKVFEYGSVIRDVVDIHYPCVEMTSSSKISCIIWNSYHKNVLASSDYEGAVTVWDAATGQRTKTFQEHEKRCWSVDFNAVDSRLIASGSDDARVKLWNINMENSVASLEAKANVCCVKFNPCSSYHLAFGSADHCVHYYDLRNMKDALMVFKGHRKAVSYVKFLNKEDIVSASTDSQLKMWNINNLHCLRSFVGHTNEKNFVGLATDGDYIACGSENNSLYVYYKGLTKQLFSFKFDAVRSILEKDRKEDDVKEFVSAVCWRQNSNVVVSANSQGIIKILELV